MSQLRISVMEQISFLHEESVEGIRGLSSALLHEDGRGMRRDARDLHAPCGQFYDHELFDNAKTPCIACPQAGE